MYEFITNLPWFYEHQLKLLVLRNTCTDQQVVFIHVEFGHFLNECERFIQKVFDRFILGSLLNHDHGMTPQVVHIFNSIQSDIVHFILQKTTPIKQVNQLLASYNTFIGKKPIVLY